MSIFKFTENLFESVGTKAKEAAAKVAEPYLPPEPPPEPYQWQEPLNLDAGLWTDPIPEPMAWEDPLAMPFAGGGFDGAFTPDYSAETLDFGWDFGMSEAPAGFGAADIYAAAPQPASPIDWGQWDSQPIPGEAPVDTNALYNLNFDWNQPITDYDTWTGTPIQQTGWTVNDREVGSAAGSNPVKDGLGQAWDAYNLVNDSFAETGLDLTPAGIDLFSGQAINDLASNIPGPDWLGDAAGAIGEQAFRFATPIAGGTGMFSDAAGAMGWYQPSTGYDDVASTGRNLIDSGFNPVDFAQRQQDDLYERPFGEQLFGQAVFDPTNVVGSGFLSKADNVPDWLRGLDAGIDAAQSAPFKTLGFGRFGDTAAKALGAGDEGAAAATFGARVAAPAIGGGIGYATGDTEEERMQRAAIGAVLAGSWSNADLLGKTYGAGLRLFPKDIGEKVRMGIDPLASRTHLYTNEILPIPEIRTDLGLTLGDRVSGVKNTLMRDVQDNPAVKDAFTAIKLVQGKSRALANEMVGSLMQKLDDAGIRIDDATGRALTRDGNFMPVFKTGQKGIDPGDVDAGAFDNIVTTNVVDEAADWADVAEQWKRYLDEGYIDQQQVDALRAVDQQLGRIRQQQIAMKIPQPKDRPLWNAESLYFPRGMPETQNAPLNPLKGEDAQGVKVLGRTPGSSREAKFETAGENIVENNMRYPDLETRLSAYTTKELEEIVSWGILPQIDDVKLGINLPMGDGQPARELTLGDLLFRDKDELAKVQKELAPYKKIQRESMAKAKIYTRSAGINEDTAARLRKSIQSVRDQYGDVNPQTVKSAATFIREEASTAIDDAVAVLDSADDMWRTAAKEGDSIRRLQIQKAPEIREEMRQLRAQLRDSKKALEKVQASLDAADGAVNLDVPGMATTDVIVAEAIADQLADAVRLRDKMLKATPNAFPEGAAQTMREADALKGFGNRMVKTGKKKFANAAEEIGSIYRALGEVEAVQRELAKQTAAGQRQSDLAAYHLQKVVKAIEDQAPLVEKRDQLRAAEKFAARAREAVRDTGVTGQLNISGLMNIDLPENIATTGNRILQDYFRPGARKLDKLAEIIGLVNKITRPLVTTLDASFAAATGGGVLMDNPAAWARGTKQGLEAMAPKVGRNTEQIAADNLVRWNNSLSAFSDMPKFESLISRYGLQISPSEVSLGAASRDSAIGAIKQKGLRGTMDAFGNLPLVKQSGQGYTTAGNAYRGEYAVQALLDARIRNGAPLTADTINSIVTAANTVGARANRQLGGSIAGVNMPISERALGDVWFAGRAYQSFFDMLGNSVLNGNLEGDLARKTAIRIATGGLLTTLVLNDLLGQETDLNPLTDGGWANPNWARVRLLGQDISPFGMYDSLAKAILATTLDPEDSPGAVADFFRSRLAPGPALVWDKIMNAGEFASGEQSLGTVAKYLNPTPLGVRNALDSVLDTDWTDKDSVAEALFGIGAGLAGLKASPLSETERMYEAASKEYDGLRYKGADLSRAQTKFVKDAAQGNIENDPLALAQWKKSNPDLVPEPKSEESKAYAAAKADRDAAYADINERFTAKGSRMTLADMKEERKVAQGVYRELVDAIDFGEDRKAAEGSPQAWVDGYFDIFDTATGADGEVDWDKFDKGYQRLLKEYGKTSREREAIDAYIEEYLRKELPESLYAEKKAYSELEELGAFDMPRYNLQVLDDESALEYLAQVREAQEIDWSERNTKPGVDKPPLASFAPKWLKEELDLTTKEIQDVMRVNAGEKYWTKEYRDLRDEHPELFIWFKPTTTWAVIQAKGGD